MKLNTVVLYRSLEDEAICLNVNQTAAPGVEANSGPPGLGQQDALMSFLLG